MRKLKLLSLLCLFLMSGSATAWAGDGNPTKLVRLHVTDNRQIKAGATYVFNNNSVSARWMQHQGINVWNGGITDDAFFQWTLEVNPDNAAQFALKSTNETQDDYKYMGPTVNESGENIQMQAAPHYFEFDKIEVDGVVAGFALKDAGSETDRWVEIHSTWKTHYTETRPITINDPGVWTMYQVVEGVAIDRTNWGLTCSTWSPDGTNSAYGRITDIIDGNADTHWHSAYNNAGSGAGTSELGCPQWFLIDMQSSQEVVEFGYTRRGPNGGNGDCTGYKLYVSNDPILLTTPMTAASQNEVNDLDIEPVQTGTLSRVNGEQKVVLDHPASGRYVLFVVTAGQGNFASCGEFNLYTYGGDIQRDLLLTGINEAQTLLHDAPTGTQVGAVSEQTKTILQGAINQAQGVYDNAGLPSADYSNAFSVLEAAVEDFNSARVKIEDDGIYMFVYAKDGKGDGFAMYSDGADLKWNAKNVASNKYYWQLIKNGAGYNYKVKNGDGMYFAAAGENGGDNGNDLYVRNENEAKNTTFTHLEVDVTKHLIKIAGNAPAHAGSHGGASGNVIPYHNESNNTSAWRLFPVSGYDVYNVVVEGAENVQVTHTNGDKAVNGGFFVFPTGTELNANDFGASVVAFKTPTITIDGNTIKVTYAEATSHIRRESMPLPGNTYMIFNAGTVAGEDWTGMVYYENGVKLNKAEKPSTMTDADMTNAYKWTLTKGTAGYKLYSATSPDMPVNASGELVDAYMVIHPYHHCNKKCGSDVWVLLDDELTKVNSLNVTAENRVFVIHSTDSTACWKANSTGMLLGNNPGFFPFAFYTTYKYTNEQWALYTEAKSLIDKAGLVGCPAENNTVGAEIKSLLCVDPATADWETKLTAKIAAYKAVTEVVLPASGWYKIKNKQLQKYLFSESNENSKNITYINDGGDNSKYYWYVTFNNGQATVIGTTGLSMARGSWGDSYDDASTEYLSPIALQSAQNGGVSWTEGYFLFPNTHSTAQWNFTRKYTGYNSDTNPYILTNYGVSGADNQYTFEAVEVADDGIYTVVVSGYSGEKLPAVTYTVGGYTGNATVYNGGKYFLETAPTKDDFTVLELEDYLSTVTVEGNTINVVYTYTGEMTYLPLKRATEIVAGKTYMIYNATRKENGTDYTGFILNNGASVRLEKSKPAAFVTMDKNALWQVEETANGKKYLQSLADNHYVSATGDLSAEAQEINIDGYTSESVKKLGSQYGFRVELEDGTLGDINEEHNLYALYNGEGGWNGTDDGQGFRTQIDAYMPFAFHEVGEYTSWALQLYEEAKEVVAKGGKVGYPKAGNTTGAEIKQLLATDPATEEGWATTLQAKVDAYKAITDVQMPENGKVYTITAVNTSGTKAYLNYTGETNGYRLAQGDVIPETGYFFCRTIDDNGNTKYVFTNMAGKYFVWKGNNGYNGNKGFNNGYDVKYSPVEFKKLTAKFGALYMVGERPAGTATLVLNNALGENDFNANNGDNQLFDNEHTSALLIEEVIDPRPTVNVTAALNDGKYVATYSTVFPTVVPEGVVAYGAATQTASENATTVTMQPMAIAGEAIPANTGVLLVAEGTTTLSPADMKPATTEVKNEVYPETNLFVGTGNTGATVDADVNAFILADGGSGVGFYKLSSTAREIAAYRAYLDIPTAAEIRNLHISFGDGSATAIETVEADAAGQPMYDLSGRRVVNPVKGSLYIKNGKKYIYK